MSEQNDLLEALLEFVANNETMESEYASRVERWCFYCGAYLDPKEGIKHKPDCLYSWVVGFLESRKPTIPMEDEVVDRLIEEQKFKDEDYQDQLLEEEALSHGFA